jgi:hypothetical protein
MKTATCPRTYHVLAAELDALQRDLGLLRWDDTNASQCFRLGEAQHLVVRARALVLSVEEEPDREPCMCFTGLCTACMARALETQEVGRSRALVLSVQEEPEFEPCTCFTGLCTACLARARERAPSTEETPYLHAGACPHPETHGTIGRNALGKFDRTFGGLAYCPWCGWTETPRARSGARET